MKQAIDIKVGNLLIIDGKIYKVESAETKGAAKAHKTVNIKMRSILDNKYMEHTFHQEEKIEEADLTNRKAIYSYKDGSNLYFLDEENYETYSVSKDIIGKKEVFLKEEAKYTAVIYEGKVIDLIFPERIRLKVTTAPPGLRQHDTATTAKEVTLENGVKIDVPQFVEEGNTVEVDSNTGKYIDRVQ